jgi:hypothetical protein
MLLVALIVIVVTILVIILTKIDKLPIKKSLIKPLVIVLIIEIVFTVILFKKAKNKQQALQQNQAVEATVISKDGETTNQVDTKVVEQENQVTISAKEIEDLKNELEATKVILKLLQQKYDELESSKVSSKIMNDDNFYDKIMELTDDIKEFDSKVNLLWKPDSRKREIARKTQELLKGIDFYHGELDGDVESTYEAIITYKRRKGLRNRGYLTPRVLETILVDYYRLR